MAIQDSDRRSFDFPNASESDAERPAYGPANNPNQGAFSCLPGVFLAGAAYPFLIAFFFVPLGMAYNGFPVLSLFDLFSIIADALYYAFNTSVVGLIISVVTGFIAATLISLFNWSLDYPLPKRWVVAMTGGLAGYLPTCYLLLPAVFDAEEWISKILAVGAVWLAVLVGQFGARYYYCWSNGISMRESGGQIQFQFQVKHLLWLTVWAGALMTFSQLSTGFFHFEGSPFVGFELLFLTSVWLLMQLTCIGAERVNFRMWRAVKVGA